MCSWTPKYGVKFENGYPRGQKVVLVENLGAGSASEKLKIRPNAELILPHVSWVSWATSVRFVPSAVDLE